MTLGVREEFEDGLELELDVGRGREGQWGGYGELGCTAGCTAPLPPPHLDVLTVPVT